MRNAAWLSAERVGAFTRILLLFWLAAVASIPWTLPAMQVGHDFGAFWTASGLALQGRVVAAYGPAAQAAMAGLFGAGHYPPFFYPPSALLLWLPFASLPFAAAAALWIGITALLYALGIRAVAGRRALIPALAFPAALVCGLFGQNALLSAALFAGAAACLDRRPVLAGGFIGCLAYKPQLAVLAPLVLICAGRWRAFASAAATTIGLVALSVLAFGMRAWWAFIAALPVARAWNENGMPGFDKFASLYAAARLLGASRAVAWGLQGLVSVAAVGVLVWALRRGLRGSAEIVLLLTATGFCVPFLGAYDLAIFAVTGAWIAAEAGRTGWLAYERATLAALYLAPIAIIAAAAQAIPLAPPWLVALAWLVLRRIAAHPPRRAGMPRQAA